MRILVFVMMLGGLAACGGQEKLTTFTCPNGPDLVVTYSDDTARIAFPGGRVETLDRVEEDKDLYAKPGVVWDAEQFRSGRLTDGQSSYACDQMAG